MESVQNSAVSEEDIEPIGVPSAFKAPEDTDDDFVPPVSEDEDAVFKYSAEANTRRKRSLPNPNKRKSCSLYIQTDPLFWRHIRDQVRYK